METRICAPSSEVLLRHSTDRTKWRSGSTCCNARKWIGAWGREVRPASRLGSIGSRPCSTLLFLGSDRSAPCANLKERSDFGSGSTRSPCRPTLPSTIYHARKHNILQMLALCLIYNCIPVFANSQVHMPRKQAISTCIHISSWCEHDIMPMSYTFFSC
jgi:hypothetical protein